jgi:hypothetical protein
MLDLNNKDPFKPVVLNNEPIFVMPVKKEEVKLLD